MAQLQVRVTPWELPPCSASARPHDAARPRPRIAAVYFMYFPLWLVVRPLNKKLYYALQQQAMGARRHSRPYPQAFRHSFGQPRAPLRLNVSRNIDGAGQRHACGVSRALLIYYIASLV